MSGMYPLTNTAWHILLESEAYIPVVSILIIVIRKEFSA